MRTTIPMPTRIMRARLLPPVLLLQLLLLLPTPCRAESYTAVGAGRCRGPGGPDDLVNHRTTSTLFSREAQCVDACDSLSGLCAGYSWQPPLACAGTCAGSPGICTIYGPGIADGCPAAAAGCGWMPSGWSGSTHPAVSIAGSSGQHGGVYTAESYTAVAAAVVCMRKDKPKTPAEIERCQLPLADVILLATLYPL